jgi:hypothetical protein
MEVTTALRARNGAVRFIPKRGVSLSLTTTCLLHLICKILKNKEVMAIRVGAENRQTEGQVRPALEGVAT